VVVDFRKLAGILVETSGESQGPSVAVIGVGVNYRLGEKALDLIDQAVTDVAQCAPQLPSRTELLGELLASLAVALTQFDAQGFAAARDPWRALHAYHGRRVRVFPAHEAAYDAQVVDVASDGALVVSTPDGRTLNLASADISLRTR
jgi:BirA family transcriptional regulator, biotin operon repressor / biotin---[acetyl-CoA-carboxylase] ligase